MSSKHLAAGCCWELYMLMQRQVPMILSLLLHGMLRLLVPDKHRTYNVRQISN